MIKISKIIYKYMLVALLVLTCFMSCEDDDELYPVLGEEPRSITEVLASTPELSTLNDAITRLGLDQLFSETTTYTVLAPNNDAFSGTNIDELTDDQLMVLLSNHIIEATEANFSTSISSHLYTQSVNGPGETNLSVLSVGSESAIEFNGSVSTVSGGTNIGATNGTIHIVEALIPEPTVANLSMTNPDFSTFISAISKSGLTEDFVALLNGASFNTVFVPSNDAFEAFLATTNGTFGWASLDDVPVDTLEELLKYHFISGENLRAADFYQEVATLQGEGISVVGTAVNDQSDDDANIINADVQGTNGVIHIVDKVLLTSAVEQAIKDQIQPILLRATDRGYTTLVSAIEFIGISNLLQGDGSYTLFAPTNDALAGTLLSLGFENGLSDIDTDEEKETLKTLLEFHIVSGSFLSSDLTDGLTLTTVQGEVLTIDAGGSDPLIIDYLGAPASIPNANIGASNGVLHGIGKVLMPQVIVDEFDLAIIPSPIYSYDIYTEGPMKAGWNIGGWGDVESDFSSSGEKWTGSTSMGLTFVSGWTGFDYQADAAVDITAYSSIKLSIFAGDDVPSDGQVRIALNGNFNDTDPYQTFRPLAAGWNHFEIPLSDLGNPTQFTALGFQLSYAGTIYVDDAGFVESHGYEAFTDGENAGWTVGGWGNIIDNGTYEFNSTEQVYLGANSMKLDFDGAAWTGFNYQSDAPVDISGFATLKIAIFAVESGQQVRIALNGNFNDTDPYQTFRNLNAGEWNYFEIPLADIGSPTEFTGIGFQYSSGGVLYVDNVVFD